MSTKASKARGAQQSSASELSQLCERHIEQWGFGRVQIVTFVWCCLVWICSNSLVGTAIPIISKGLSTDMGLSTKGMSVLQATVSLGAVAGGVVCAELLERLGRRTGITLVLVATPFVLAALSLTNNFWVAVVLQFVLGIVSCTETLAVKIFLSETLPSAGKGFWINIIHVSYQFGTRLTVSVETYAQSASAGDDGSDGEVTLDWRLYVRLLACLGFIVVVLSPLVPESPAWVAKQPKGSSALKSLIRNYSWIGESEQATSLAKALGEFERAGAGSNKEGDDDVREQEDEDEAAVQKKNDATADSARDSDSLIGPKFRVLLVILMVLWAARCYLKYSNSSWLREYLLRTGMGDLKTEATGYIAAAKTVRREKSSVHARCAILVMSHCMCCLLCHQAALFSIPALHQCVGIYGTLILTLLGASLCTFSIPFFADSALLTVVRAFTTVGATHAQP